MTRGPHKTPWWWFPNAGICWNAEILWNSKTFHVWLQWVVNTCFSIVFRRAPTSPTLCPETRGCETGPGNCQNTTNPSCVCFDPSFNKQLATKPPWPSIQDVLQISSESVEQFLLKVLCKMRFFFRPSRAGITLSPSPPNKSFGSSCRLPTNQPTSGGQSVALSAGTTLELGLMDTGRLMASCREAQRNNDNDDNDDGFKGVVGRGKD